MTTVDSGQQPGAELLTWLSALRTLSSAATSAADLQHVLDLVADTARTLLGFDFCGVLTPDPAGESLVITGWSGLSADYVEPRQHRSARPPRWRLAVEAGIPERPAVAIRDIAAEPEFTPWGGVAREQGYRAIVCVPLIAGDEVLGNTERLLHAGAHVHRLRDRTSGAAGQPRGHRTDLGQEAGSAPPAQRVAPRAARRAHPVGTDSRAPAGGDPSVGRSQRCRRGPGRVDRPAGADRRLPQRRPGDRR